VVTPQPLTRRVAAAAMWLRVSVRGQAAERRGRRMRSRPARARPAQWAPPAAAAAPSRRPPTAGPRSAADGAQHQLRRRPGDAPGRRPCRHRSVGRGPQAIPAGPWPEATGHRGWRICSQVWDTAAAHATAVGKALLAALPRRGRRALLGEQGLPPFTSSTVTDAAELGTELAGLAPAHRSPSSASSGTTSAARVSRSRAPNRAPGGRWAARSVAWTCPPACSVSCDARLLTGAPAPARPGGCPRIANRR